MKTWMCEYRLDELSVIHIVMFLARGCCRKNLFSPARASVHPLIWKVYRAVSSSHQIPVVPFGQKIT